MIKNSIMSFIFTYLLLALYHISILKRCIFSSYLKIWEINHNVWPKISNFEGQKSRFESKLQQI